MLTAKASCTVKPFNCLDLEVQAYFAARPDRQLMSQWSLLARGSRIAKAEAF